MVATSAATRRSRATPRSIGSTTRTSENCEIVWRRPAADPELQAAFPDLGVSAYLRSTPILVDGVLYAPERARAAGGVRPGDRRDHLASTAVRRHRGGGRRRQHAGSRLVDGRRRPGGCCWFGAGTCMRSTRGTGRRVVVVRPRRSGPGRPGLGASPCRRVRLDGRADRGRRRRGGGRHDRRLGRRRRRSRGGPGGRPRLRRAHGRAALDVPRGPAGKESSGPIPGATGPAPTPATWVRGAA